MSLKVKLLLTVVFIAAFLSASGQCEKDSLMKVYMGKAKDEIGKQDFNSADQYLRKIFGLKCTIPDEVAFMFGRTQLGLKNYTKARDGFRKYLELTGYKGSLADSAVQLILEAEKNICPRCNNTGVAQVTDSCAFCKGQGVYFQDCEACRGKGKQLCYVCSGNGVSARPGPFGIVYQNCSHCQGKGMANCVACKGTGKKERFCELCKGKGFLKREEVCEHK